MILYSITMNPTKITKLIAGTIFCLGLTLHAQDAKPGGSLAQNSVYQSNCAKCHGKTAGGRFMAGPSLVSGKATSLSADELRDIITKGKHHMPKFEGKLSANDIDALVDQIHSDSKQK